MSLAPLSLAQVIKLTISTSWWRCSTALVASIARSAGAVVRIDRLLGLAQPHADARYVSFISVTSYRWSLPIDEARWALVATHVGDEALSHDHGAPLRLVAPGRRGFEWVKWITRIELRTEPDLGQVVAIHASGFTPEGRGER